MTGAARGGCAPSPLLDSAGVTACRAARGSCGNVGVVVSAVRAVTGSVVVERASGGSVSLLVDLGGERRRLVFTCRDGEWDYEYSCPLG